MKEKLYTIGEVAHLMNVTVRTLQYYDRQDLLKPTTLSDGRRRLYSAKDIVKLHQILSFKYLGFSLKEIKNKLFSLNDVQEVIQTLEYQKKVLKQQVVELNHAIEAIEGLHEEICTTKEVDFKKYAEIIEILKIGNHGYWAWKQFDDSLKDHIYQRFGKDPVSGCRIFETYQSLLEEAYQLKQQQEKPTGEKFQLIVSKWWEMILEFTGGNLELVEQLEAFNQTKEQWDQEVAKKQREIDESLNTALEYYLKKEQKK